MYRLGLKGNPLCPLLYDAPREIRIEEMKDSEFRLGISPSQPCAVRRFTVYTSLAFSECFCA